MRPISVVPADISWRERAIAVVAALVLAGSGIAWLAENSDPAERNSGALRTAISRLIPAKTLGGPDSPDVQAAVYGGYSTTDDSDIVLRQPNGTDMTVRDVRWHSEPNKMPPYHGFRSTWWFPAGHALGAMADLVYVKVIADREREVAQSGTRDGVAVPPVEKLSATFDRLEFTDGLNMLTGSMVYRLPLPGKMRPYVGVGIGASLPHAEVRRKGAAQRTFSFQLAGYVIQAFAGIEIRFGRRGSVFAEYRSSYATNTVALDDGGTLQADQLVNHFSAGVTGHLRTTEPAALSR